MKINTHDLFTKLKTLYQQNPKVQEQLKEIIIENGLQIKYHRIICFPVYNDNHDILEIFDNYKKASEYVKNNPHTHYMNSTHPTLPKNVQKQLKERGYWFKK